MKKIFIAVAALAFATAANAQWNFDVKNVESLTGEYKSLGKKATAITTNAGGAALGMDDDNSAVQNIGFDFKFNGKTFNQFVLNTNGFIKLGNVAPSAVNIYYPNANLATGGAINVKDSNLIYPFNRNLEASDKSAAFKVQTQGSAGERICTIEFKNLTDKIKESQYTSVSFQIKLYEGTNVIEFIYDEFKASENAALLSIAAVGIKGDDAANSINVAKGSGISWSNEMNKPQQPYVFMNGNYSTKGPNFGNKNNALPEAGHTYRFTPLK